ncbi:MAG: diguanylate cyclase, partial [Chloroflexi bacterium]|nr:diguanylate cyclase [Chloroflexota bacterium]
MVSVRRFVILTISIVVLAGVLSGGAALFLTLRVNNSYDDAMKRELQEKALAYGDTARAFLAAAGPDAPAVIQAVVLNSRANAATDPPKSPEEGFTNAFLNLEIWLPDDSSANGFQLIADEIVVNGREGTPDEELVTGLLSTASESGAAAAALDEDAHLILLAVPIVLDEETTIVALGTLSAEDDFAFFGAQHGDALRNSIALSIWIIVLIVAFGGTLSLIVSRQLSRSSKELRAKSDLIEAALKKERERARRDQLTGVLNHGAIMAELRDLVEKPSHGAGFAVALVDVDGLKTVNDTYGHQTGDEVLIAVAQALSSEDRIIGRYGGDEFLVILPDAARPAAEEYQREVLDALTAACFTDEDTGARVPMTVSIGLAIYPSEATQIEALIKLADNAMYASRRQRPVGAGDLSPSRTLGGDRAAAMVGQIVPLLTASGTIEDKLRLVAHRLSVGAGYDAVNMDVFAHAAGLPTARNTFSRVPDEVVDAWQAERRRMEDEPILRQIKSTRRALIVEDPQQDERLTEAQRAVLRAAELQSAVVVPLFWEDGMIGVLSVASKRKDAFTAGDIEFLTAVATQITSVVRMATLFDELQSTSEHLAQAREEAVLLLAAAAEAHDTTTGQHLRGVRGLTEALARDLSYGEESARDLGMAAVLHDIGKIRVPQS